MKKIDNKGFMLAETLIVTTFVAGVLIFLFIQFSTLNSSYNEYFVYNPTESLYSLNQVKNYIKTDTLLMDSIQDNIDSNNYLEISDCSLAGNTDYCLKLFELIEVNKIYVLYNSSSYNSLNISDVGVNKFLNKISNTGSENYRLVASFDNGTFATVRFGD